MATLLTSNSKTYRADELVVNFHNAVIYGSDLKLVQRRREWLNDACINFFFAVLSRSASTDHVVFMDPSVVSFFMHQCTDDEDLADFRDGLQYPPTGKIIVPINDNMALASHWQRPGGGNHWSLLVVVTSSTVEDVQYWHFDSGCGSNNAAAARDVTRKMNEFLFKGEGSQLVETSTPRQANGYDCGVHMLAAAELFESMVSINLEDYEAALRNFVRETPDFCVKLRGRIENEILRLATDSSWYE
jgi:sentrin-specific protease 8